MCDRRRKSGWAHLVTAAGVPVRHVVSSPAESVFGLIYARSGS
jgi:hypothetical protein